ncbi:MAG: calcium/sodium antiporter [Phycisphaerae bacterium]|nr:calcium/sodium antiporter [Phycisphaerae bacterium]
MYGSSLLILVGLLLLWKGADFLVRGAVRLARRIGVSQLVVGMTVVAMGTSAPEVAASIAAALASKGDITLGNIYGSNIANLAMIGGLVALIRPLQVRAATLRREIPAMLAFALLLWPVLSNLTVSRIEAIALLVVFVAMMAYTVRMARVAGVGDSPEASEVPRAVSGTAGRDVFLVVFGLAALAIGARATVSGAVAIGSRIGLSDAVIGSTIIAVGTSLPELVTCLVAAVQGHHDLSVGNLVGSNIFNTLFVAGLAAMARPLHVGARFAGGPDYWIMVGVAVAFTGAAILGARTIRKPSGIVLLTIYGAYIAYLLATPGGA